MKKFRLIAAAAIVGAMTLFSSGAAHAGYADPSITITIDDSDIIGGTTFSYKASSGSAVQCKWTITYEEGHAADEPAVQTGNGTSISGTYRTKVVKKVFRSPITAVCEYDDQQTAGSAAAAESVAPAFYSTASGSSTLQTATQQAGASATVTLRPLGSSEDGGALPNTGGSNLWVVLLGAGLLFVGGGVTYLARRRQSGH